MIKRTITAIAILAVVIPAILFGGWALFALIAAIVVGGGIELTKTAPNISKWPLWFRVVLIGIVLGSGYLPLMQGVGLIGIGVMLCLVMPVFNRDMNYLDTFTGLAYTVIMFTLIRSFLAIHDANKNYVWLIIWITYVCDTFAYLCGRTFGKHKLAPSVSPKKTIEGSVGGWLFGGVLGFLAIYFFIPEFPLIPAIAVCVFLPIVGQLGDLSFSSIKRDTNLKDFSNLLPGHGGILDRIDSLVFTLITFYTICTIMGVM